MMNARQAALFALERCRREGAWSAQVLDELINRASLDRREAALASRICLGVIQNNSLCDYYIDCYSSTKAKKLEPKIRDILHIGIYQLAFMNTPERAAVNESVRLCKESGFARASGLVNAVLRRVAENRMALPEVPNAGTAEHLSIKYSHPVWLVKRLIREQDYARAEGFLASNNQPPPLTIQVNTLKIAVPDYVQLLRQEGIGFVQHPWLSGCLMLNGGSVTALPGFQEGLFYVQDAAARAAVEIAQPRKGMRVLDACSAPGGKSFSAAVRMENEGQILSCDIHEKKLRLIRDGAQRLGINIIETSCEDARQRNEANLSAFDLVITDVPCSGIGVIRKKPEIRRKEEKEIQSLPAIQEAILENLSSYVKPGGVLLYSTCTVLADENEKAVAHFLERRKDYRASPFCIGEIRAENGMHSFWPDVDGTDGFFAAKLMRMA